MQTTLSTLVLLVALLLATPSTAQVTARQGEPAKTEATERFKSPMVLELPLVVARSGIPAGGSLVTKEASQLRRYICDGVSIIHLAMSVTRKRSGDAKFQFQFMLSTEESWDRLVDVEFAAVAGDRSVGAVITRNIDAEEGKTVTRKADLVLNKDALDALGEQPVLRITVTVRDNE
jgi:hypothetical protein